MGGPVNPTLTSAASFDPERARKITANIRRNFDRGAEDYARFEQQSGFFTQLLGELTSLAPTQPGTQVLDVGCGTGRQAQLLRESIPEADPRLRWNTTVDLSETEQEEYLRQGCKFAGRCPKVMDICRTVMPADIAVNDVLVKCHLYGEAETA